MKIHILFLLFLFQLSEQLQLLYKKSKNNVTEYFAPEFFRTLLKHAEVDNDKIEKCFSDKEKFSNEILNIFQFSGKRFGDIGNENSCEKSKLTYLLYINEIDSNITYIKSEYLYPTLFLNSKQNYVGICIDPNCIEAIFDLINENSNDLNIIFNATYFQKSKIFLKPKFRKQYPFFNYSESYVVKELQIKYSYYYKIVKVYLIIYILLMIICTMLKMFFFFSSDNEVNNTIKKIKFDEDDNDNDDDSDDENYSSIFQKIDKNNNLVSQNHIMINYLIRFCSIFDIIFNLKLFLYFKSFYFNGSGIEIIGFLRFLCVIGMIFGKNFLLAVRVFHQVDIYYTQIYYNIFIILIKLTFFINISWIILDGTVFGFKLLSYIKTSKQKNENDINIHFCQFFKFILYFIPKVFIFLFCYFFEYIFFSNETNDVTGLEYYLTLMREKECYNDPIMIFNPFLNYFSEEEKCFSFTYIFINEFYVMIFILIIVFISLKLKNKFFDITFSVLLLINLFCFQIVNYYKNENEHSENNNPYLTIDFFIGQIYIEKQIHLFLSIFFLGFLIGNIFFHFHDSVSPYSLTAQIDYMPFSFTREFMSRINVIKIKYNIIWICICSFILLLISSVPYFFRNYFGFSVEELGDLKTFFIIIKYFRYYEKIVFAIAFSFLLVFLKIISENSFLSPFMQSNFLVSFEKIRVSFFCSIDIFLVYCYAYFKFNYLISYNNFMFITFGLFMFIYVFCSLMYILFELIFIKFVKAITNEEKINENKSINPKSIES